MAAATIALLKKNKRGSAVELVENSGALQLPPEEEWIKSGTLEKRVFAAQESWHWRRVVLTKELFAVTRVDSTDIIDQIYLVEIEGTEVRDPPHDTGDSPLKTNPGRRMSGITTAQTGALTRSVSVNRIQSINQDSTQPEGALFDVKTSNEGYNSGRIYTFRADEKDTCQDWARRIDEVSALAKDRAMASGDKLEQIRGTIKYYYDCNPTQMIIALLIIGSFAVSCLNAELVPDEGTWTFDAFEDLDLAFTCIFTVEVCMNLLGNWFYPFWAHGWNVFDFVIVAVSLVSIPLNAVPAFNLLRLLRVFRVVRLFRRLKSLAKIISALTAALLPVANAFMVLALVTCIYAVLAVHFFEDNPYFQNFSASVFSMFQICTGDSWASVIVRPMFGSVSPPSIPHFPTAFFFFSYILVVGTFLLNVVIAVLLDEFISAVQRHKEEEKRQGEEAKADARRQLGGALDPLLLTFSNASTKAELSERMRALYKVLDKDDSGGLEYAEMRDGLRRLQFEPALHLSEEDFDDLTHGRALCNDEGELDIDAFEIMMTDQLDDFVQRQMALKVNEVEQSDSNIGSLFFALNQMARRLDTQLGSGGGGDGARLDKLEHEVRGLHSKMDRCEINWVWLCARYTLCEKRT